MSLCKGYTQGGSNADIVLADAYLKNISIGVDWATGYEAVVSDAEGGYFLFVSSSYLITLSRRAKGLGSRGPRWSN